MQMQFTYDKEDQMNGNCENPECPNFHLPMRRRDDANPAIYKCEECGKPQRIDEQICLTSPALRNEGEEQLLNAYYYGHYGRSYRQHLKAGDGPFDNRRR
jgi:hypothetical protein